MREARTRPMDMGMLGLGLWMREARTRPMDMGMLGLGLWIWGC